MSEIALVMLCLAILLCWIISDSRKEERWHAERRDVLDRLMSRNLDEYKQHAELVKPSDPVTMTDQEEWSREIEMMKSG